MDDEFLISSVRKAQIIMALKLRMDECHSPYEHPGATIELWSLDGTYIGSVPDPGAEIWEATENIATKEP